MATPNTVIDLTGVMAILDVTYDALTNTLTISYEDGTTKDIILNDVSVVSVALAGTDLVVTKSDGTVYTESLATFVQTQADWNQVDTGAVDFIKNKPATESNLGIVTTGGNATVTNDNGTGIVIPAADALNAGLMTALDKSNLDALDPDAEENVQGDWDEVDALSDAFIKNKPDFNNIPLNVAYNPANHTLTVTFIGGVEVDYPLNDQQVETAAYDLLNEKIVLTKTDFSTVEVDMAQLINYVDTTFVLASLVGAVNGIATLDGSGHVPAAQVPIPVPERIDVFATVAAQTTFPAVYNPDNVDVFVNGILLQRTEYTATSGTDIELVFGVDAGTWMLVKTTPTY